MLAEILAGLGLLFVGLRSMSEQLQKATGRKVRKLLRSATGSPLAGLLCGTLAGAATQSSNAVAVICGNLVRGGVFSPRDAIPVVAGANVGTAALVFVAAIDFRLVVFYLLAVVGFSVHLRLDRRPVWSDWLGVALGLALALLGLNLIKQAPREMDLAGLAGTLAVLARPLVGFGVGFLASAVTQSSSTPSILVLALMQAQLLGLGEGAFVVLGANLGSGFASLLAAGGLEGTGRQLCYVHVLVKAVGCAVVSGGLLLAWLAGLDPAALLATLGGGRPPAALSMLFLLLQVAGALPVALLRGTTEAIASRLSPPTAEDHASRPLFIHHHALGDAPTALELAEQEIVRQVRLLPMLLPDLDQELAPTQDRGVPDRAGELLAMWRGCAAVTRAVEHYLADLIALGMARGTLTAALHQQALLDSVRTLQDTLHDFAEVIEGFDKVPPLAFNLSESLRTMVVALAEATEGGTEDFDILITLTADRSELLNRLRRQLASAAHASEAEARQLLLATSLFERSVWLVRRVAVALRAHANEANAEPSADVDPRQVEADAHRT